ncbi:MAG: hypothetical protein V1847_02595 [Candidatus Diapherotrites archaeon]
MKQFVAVALLLALLLVFGCVESSEGQAAAVPNIVITAPAQGVTISSGTEVVVQTSKIAPTSVELWLNDKAIASQKPTGGQTIFIFKWDPSTTVPQGKLQNTLVAKALTKSGTKTSKTVTVNVLAPPQKFSLGIDTVSNKPFLAWTAATWGGVQRFEVQRRTVSGQSEQIAVLPAGTFSFTDSEAQEGTQYYYKMRALDATGNIRSEFTTEQYVIVPSSKIVLVGGKGYPYDPNNNSGVYNYTTTLIRGGTLSNPNIYGILIENSAERWTEPYSNPGMLWPTQSEQSLTGHAGTIATFGQSIPGGYPGSSYSSVTFDGFNYTMPISKLYFGKILGNETEPSMDSRAIGKVEYTANDNKFYRIPMALQLDWTSTGSTFSFNEQTIWYKINEGTGGSIGTYDAEFNVKVSDYVNGRKWTSDIDVTNKRVTLSVYNSSISKKVLNIGDIVTVDGVSFKFKSVGTGGDHQPFATFAADNQLKICLNAVPGCESKGQGYFLWGGKELYLSNDSTWDVENVGFGAHDLNLVGNNNLLGSGNNPFYYAIRADLQAKRLWLVLDADQNYVAQYGNIWRLSQGVENDDNPKIVSYFSPDSSWWYDGYNSRSPGDAQYYAAVFDVIQTAFDAATQEATIYLDSSSGGLIGPFPNSNLNIFTKDATVWSYDFAGTYSTGTMQYNLISGTQETFLKGAYTATGGKFVLDETNDGIAIALPDGRGGAPKVQFRIINIPKGITETYLDGLRSSISSSPSITTEVYKDPFLEQEGSINGTYNSQSYPVAYNEKFVITADARMDPSADVKDLVANIDSGGYRYQLDFSPGLPLDASGKYQSANGNCFMIPFFGKEYQLESADFSETTSAFQLVLSLNACATLPANQLFSGTVGLTMGISGDRWIEPVDLSGNGVCQDTVSAWVGKYAKTNGNCNQIAGTLMASDIAQNSEPAPCPESCATHCEAFKISTQNETSGALEIWNTSNCQ